MYKNIHADYQSKQVHIWDDVEGHIIHPLNEFNYAYKLISEDEADTRDSNVYKTIEGKWVKRVKNPSWKSREQGLLIEHDIPITTRVLLEKYGNDVEPPSNLNVFNFDIETEMTDQFPDWKDPQNAITSIAFFNSNTDEFVCLIWDEENTLDEITTEFGGYNVQVYPFATEEELLETFLAFFKLLEPDILTGWNINGFDVPYLYNRMVRVIGEGIANQLSPIGSVHYDDYKNRYKIAGISCLDYMDLYKKFEMSKSPSYKLDAIGREEVGLGKIHYTGTLDTLFKSDINKFIEYNVNDVLIVKKLDEKLDYINVSVGLCHQGHVPYEDVYQSSRYVEGAIIDFCRQNRIVTKNKPVRDPDYPGIPGAYVRPPVVGRYEYIYDLDLTSLYPSTIISLNVSPETKVGKIFNWNNDKWLDVENNKDVIISGIYRGQEFETKLGELKELLEGSNCSLSANGILYTLDFVGFLPRILIKWFDQRVEFKRLRDEAYENGDNQLGAKYHRLQYLKKIQLNSVYGVLGLSTFRIFDPDNAFATTSTAKSIILESARVANEYYVSQGLGKEEHVIYIDTDSVAKDSKLSVDGNDVEIQDVFNDLSKTHEIVKNDKREFIFPKDLSLPYFDEKNQVVKQGKVDYIERHKVKKRMYRLKTKSGKHIDVTEDHSIMILREDELVEVKPKDLQKGDKLIKKGLTIYMDTCIYIKEI